jgi:hypothetical protein
MKIFNSKLKVPINTKKYSLANQLELQKRSNKYREYKFIFRVGFIAK